jgi:hypothetical protein
MTGIVISTFMLAIETSSHRRSVALAADGNLITSRRLDVERPHTLSLFPAVAEQVVVAARLAAEGRFCQPEALLPRTRVSPDRP